MNSYYPVAADTAFIAVAAAPILPNARAAYQAATLVIWDPTIKGKRELARRE